ncbi:MAG: hypothetical protein WA447_06360 [Candidatus Binatus sp.]
MSKIISVPVCGVVFSGVKVVFQHAIVAGIDHDQVAGIVESDAERTALGGRGRRYSKVTRARRESVACPNERSAVVFPLPALSGS